MEKIVCAKAYCKSQNLRKMLETYDSITYKCNSCGHQFKMPKKTASSGTSSRMVYGDMPTYRTIESEKDDSDFRLMDSIRREEEDLPAFSDSRSDDSSDDRFGGGDTGGGGSNSDWD